MMVHSGTDLGARDRIEHHFRNTILKVEHRCLRVGLPRGLVVRGLHTIENFARVVRVIP